MMVRMKNFWVIYFVTFVVGSAVVYVVAPKVGPAVAACFRAGEPSSGVEGAIVPGPAENAPPAAAPARPADVPLKTLDEDDMSPALAGVFLARASEPPAWGVTSHKISYYKADGSYVGTVEGGVLFDCANTITSSKGSMIECRFLQEGMPDAQFLIGRKDAVFFIGSHKRLSKARVRALKDYYALNGKVEARKAELLEKGASQNPHFAAARVAHEAYQKNIQEAARLEQMRSKLADEKRMELEEQLRELKLKEIRLKKAFEEAQDKFTAWKKDHAADLPQPENDADIQAWTQEKKRLAAALPGLAF